MTVNIYEELSKERKELQEQGLLPEFYTTGGYQLLKSKYLSGVDTPKDRYQAIARAAAKYLPNSKEWEKKFFNVLWKGWLSPATPVLSNMGTDKGTPVSCTGNYINDSVFDFYNSQVESAVLTQNGFGTSSYLGDIRPRGSTISSGGKASGVLPVLKDFVQLSNDISQGCYDDSTDILTEKGWVSFQALLDYHEKGCDYKVAQVSENGEISFVFPKDYIKYYHRGEMVRFKDSKNIDLFVTPNHNMVLNRRKRKNTRKGVDRKYLSNEKYIETKSVLQRADDVTCHRDNFMSHSGISTYNGSGLSDNEKMLIAIQADGSKAANCKNAVTFRLKKERKVKRLRNLLQSLDLKFSENYYESTNTYSFYCNLGSQYDKDFSWIKIDNISYEWADEFIQELQYWDGHKTSETGISYYSVIEDNVDTVLAVASLAGYKARKSVDFREDSPNRVPLYKATLSKGTMFGTENVKKTIEQFEGYVYCVEVPQSRLVVRRNGMNVVCGNSQRRGSWAGYIPIDHGDFFEVADYLFHYPDSVNIGWVLTEGFKKRLDSGDEDALKRYQRVMKIRSTLGKGYIWKQWTANENRPQVYKDLDLDIKASNLCQEINLHSSEEYSFSCILSSMNLYKYDEWKNTDAVFIATVFLDCVAEEFLEKARNIRGMEKVVAFTEKSRAIGLGVLGFHSYLQHKGLSFEGFEAHQINTEIFKHISEESLRASQWLSKELGEPEWCKGYGVRNTHRMAVAPTMSTALICGGVSQGIEPVTMNVFNQTTAGGEIYRVSPVLIEKMKERGVYNEKTIKDIERNKGSVQHVLWLTEEEKLVFKTAFEIDQRAILRLASTRQRYIDQGQSINLFFDSDEKEEYISEITQEAINDPYIIGLYYQRGMSGVKATRGECLACHG